MYVTQLLKEMKRETNLLVFTETCMWLMVFFGVGMHGLNDAVRIARMTSIYTVNKYADSLTNAGTVRSSGNGHREV